MSEIMRGIKDGLCGYGVISIMIVVDDVSRERERNREGGIMCLFLFYSILFCYYTKNITKYYQLNINNVQHYP